MGMLHMFLWLWNAIVSLFRVTPSFTLIIDEFNGAVQNEAYINCEQYLLSKVEPRVCKMKKRSVSSNMEFELLNNESLVEEKEHMKVSWAFIRGRDKKYFKIEFSPDDKRLRKAYLRDVVGKVRDRTLSHCNSDCSDLKSPSFTLIVDEFNGGEQNEAYVNCEQYLLSKVEPQVCKLRKRTVSSAIEFELLNNESFLEEKEHMKVSWAFIKDEDKRYFKIKFSPDDVRLREAYLHDVVGKARDQTLSYCNSDHSPLNSPSFTLIVDEFSGGEQNEAYIDCEQYLLSKVKPQVCKLRKRTVSSTKEFELVNNESLVEEKQHMKVCWAFIKDEDKRYIKIEFSPDDVKLREAYLNDVVGMRDLTLFYCNSDYSAWKSVEFNQSAPELPSVLEKMAQNLCDDLCQTPAFKVVLIGRADNKTNLLAAVANWMQYDLYLLQVAPDLRDSTLKKLLFMVRNRSILVIEDAASVLEKVSNLLNTLSFRFGFNRLVVFCLDSTENSRPLDAKVLTIPDDCTVSNSPQKKLKNPSLPDADKVLSDDFTVSKSPQKKLKNPSLPNADKVLSDDCTIGKSPQKKLKNRPKSQV